MEGFSYHNIFETKGIEYLIIIGFLIMIIPFWILINKEVSIKTRIRNAIGSLSEGILKIPLGLFFSKNHTWAHLEKSGVAEVGIDDFLLHITGEVKFTGSQGAGQLYTARENCWQELIMNGKVLQVYSPISGKVTDTNRLLTSAPAVVNEDPYEKGWIYKIEPSKWIEETDTYLMANEALEWTRMEFSRFKDFIAGSVKKYSPEAAMLILQDGGELCDRPLV